MTVIPMESLRQRTPSHLERRARWKLLVTLEILRSCERLDVSFGAAGCWDHVVEQGSLALFSEAVVGKYDRAMVHHTHKDTALTSSYIQTERCACQMIVMDDEDRVAR